MRTTDRRRWVNCPAGEWGRLAATLRYHRRLALAKQTLIVVLAALGIAFGAWSVAAMFPSPSVSAPSAPCGASPCAPSPG